jgi:hypothetical protein
MKTDDRIRFACPFCSKKHNAPSYGAGREARCQNPECRKAFVVPFPDTEKPIPPAKAPRNYPVGIIAAAISLTVIGLGSFLARPSAKSKPPVVRKAERPSPVAGAEPKADPEPDPEVVALQKRELAAANERKRQEEKKERAARKEREKLLTEYVMLARIHCAEYYHNNRRVMPAKPDMPRIRQLAHSGNADIRSVAASLMKGQSMIDGFQGHGLGSTDTIIPGLVADAPNQGPMYSRGGQKVVTDAQDLHNRMDQAWRATEGVRQKQKSGRDFRATLNEMSDDRRRTIYKLAKDLSGPQADNPAIQLKADAFAPGEAAFRMVNGDSMNASYCLTLGNEDTKLTHCFIAVVLRQGVRKKDGHVEPLTALGLDEVTAAILEPDKSGLDTVSMFYVGDINPGNLIHFLPFQGATAATGSAGLVLFSDQKAVVLDPTPFFQEAREKWLAARQQQYWPAAQPRVERPAGRPSSKRAATKVAPRR